MTESSKSAPKPPAPGAQASRTCGIVGIVSGIILAPICVGFVAAIVLGIIAIVQSAKAKRLAAENPEDFARPTSSGLVMGIISVALPVVLIPVIFAIAAPALLGQRERVRSREVVANLDRGLNDLATQYDQLRENHESNPEIKAELEAHLLEAGRKETNPWNGQPAWSCTIAIADGITPKTDSAPAAIQPTELGQVRFMLQYPTTGQPGFLAGCANNRDYRGRIDTTFHKIEID